MPKKKIATIQVDLDGLWTNLKYYGHNHPVNPDPVLESSIPRYLDLFDKFDIKATFFLIGRDGEISEKAKLIRELSKAGHEIANHTYSHHFGFRKCSWQQKLAEIRKGSEIIEKITGKKPTGFKAPGYDFDGNTLLALEKEGYKYDSSMIPTFVYPLMMKAAHVISGGVKRTHGPRWKWALAPNYPYHPSSRNEMKKGKLSIMELPCTVTPFFRLPFHATFALRLGLPYFLPAYKLGKLAGTPLNYEFHALDLADDLKDLRLPHARGLPLQKRYILSKKILKIMSQDYIFKPSEEVVRGLENTN